MNVRREQGARQGRQTAKSHDQLSGRSDTGRAEAFSDGVLAIITTLLVLELKPPRGARGQLLAGLRAQWPTYLAYVTSYLYVAVIWLNHKVTFKRICTIDRGRHWANVGVLFTTALLPFATAVIADVAQGGNRSEARTAVGLYALVGALLCVRWLRLFHHLHTASRPDRNPCRRGFLSTGTGSRMDRSRSLYHRRGDRMHDCPNHHIDDFLRSRGLLRVHE